jgi:L-2-hydroxyglutarate oxidase LhgO
MLAFQTKVTGGRARAGGVEIDADITLAARCVVNAAGLHAPAIAAAIEGMPPELAPTPYLAKGNYFALSGRAPFRRLIYPVPVPGGLGTHLTLDLGGQARFGPDVEWVEREDYDVDPARGAGFYAAIRRWWPDLPDRSLHPAYSGIRPKIVPPAVASQDFVVQTPREHGVAGLINLFGIESPGLTAALALADLVRDAAVAL